MSIVAIIPARGGSKGIPTKNIHPLNNKPLIHYCLTSLKDANLDKIYVSTDCEKIKNVVLTYDNVNTIDRPAHLSTDQSPTIDTIKHCIDTLSLKEEDVLVLVQPTSPLVESKDITDGINLFTSSNEYDIIISVVYNHDVLWEENQNILIPKGHDPFHRKRRQDMKKTFSENGAFYIFKVSNITKNNCLYGYGKVGYVEMPKSRSFQIDDYEDLFIVESVLKNKV